MLARGAVVLLAISVTVAASGCDADGDDAEVAAADAPFCDAYGALLTGPLADDTTDARDPAVLRGAVATTERLVADLLESAPSEVEPAAAALAADYDATFAVLERFDYDLERVTAEATPDDHAVLDGFGGGDRFADIQRFVAGRCAPDVTLPAELLESTTSTSP